MNLLLFSIAFQVFLCYKNAGSPYERKFHIASNTYNALRKYVIF